MKIDIEEEYQRYLSRAKLAEDKMSPIQKQEIKRAFMGGFGQAAFALTTRVSSCEDLDEGVDAINDMLEQLGEYWSKEIDYHERNDN